MEMMKNCYELMELAFGASIEEIKKAYRRLALIYHPDKNQSEGALEKFKKIGGAYKYLIENHDAGKYDQQNTTRCSCCGDSDDEYCEDSEDESEDDFFFWMESDSSDEEVEDDEDSEECCDKC